MPPGSPRVIPIAGRVIFAFSSSSSAGSRRLADLVDVLDMALVDEHVRGVVPVELDAVAVVPLDVALDDFAVREDDGHRGLLVHLLEVVVVLGERVRWGVHLPFFVLLCPG